MRGAGGPSSVPEVPGVHQWCHSVAPDDPRTLRSRSFCSSSFRQLCTRLRQMRTTPGTILPLSLHPLAAPRSRTSPLVSSATDPAADLSCELPELPIYPLLLPESFSVPDPPSPPRSSPLALPSRPHSAALHTPRRGGSRRQLLPGRASQSDLPLHPLPPPVLPGVQSSVKEPLVLPEKRLGQHQQSVQSLHSSDVPCPRLAPILAFSSVHSLAYLRFCEDCRVGGAPAPRVARGVRRTECTVRRENLGTCTDT